MARTIETITEQITREERTFRVERETPRQGGYRLTIHREIVTRAGNAEIAVEPRTFAYSEPATKALSRPAFAAYVAALRTALALTDPAQIAAGIVAAEAALYDALVAEVDAEKAAQSVITITPITQE